MSRWVDQYETHAFRASLDGGVFCVFITHCDIHTGNLPAIIMNIAISLARTTHKMASISRRDLFSQCLVFKYQVFLRPLLL